MKDIRFLYKKGTGNRPDFGEVVCDNCDSNVQTENLFTEDYAEWLEDKVDESEKALSIALADRGYKEDYEEAQNEMGQLQDELEEARDYIKSSCKE